ncbi:flagellar basal body P-ring protein FlgI [Thalassotalea sp. PLHSN55]|uniref:flagellar basal body P-ring protein FlgI n=1 Tax=Thalassotalea sp. PLHSN55 TaxID=3435888 RepID=UPI003F85D366
MTWIKKHALSITIVTLVLMQVISDAAFASGQRMLLDIADVQGLRKNQLVGYGLVVGLDGSGDKRQVLFTNQSMVNMLQQFGVQLGERANPNLKNVAAVTVTADILPQAGKGQLINVTVSSIGDAKSLRGGTLLLTPLKGMDGQVYATAQGNVVVGGMKATGATGSSVTVNTPTAGNIPNGGIVEREISSDFLEQDNIILNLKKPNFKTARNIEVAINRLFGSDVAFAKGQHRVEVAAPLDVRQRVTFMSMLEEISIEMGRERPRIVFNSRTGTVVMGANIKVHKAAVSHGNLTITINENFQVSQPGAFANGETVVTPESDIYVEQATNPMFVWPPGTTLDVIVKAVNSLGASPDDLMAILQALDEAGSLEAELVVI